MNSEEQKMTEQYSDEELIKKWPGFENKYLTVNNVVLHYVEGGTGKPLICLPGWPQTWYSFHNIAPALAQQYRVIVIDIRGMGTSGKPKSGYDKKTMAKDIYELTQQLGLEKIHLLGHDIGGMVAMSMAFNYPECIGKMVIMDGAHPSEGMLQMPLVPPLGTFNKKMTGNAQYVWWMGFNQVKELPEKLLEGRFQHLLDWLFAYVMIDETKMPAFDREIYASVYNNPENIRASNAWYQTFTQDIEDGKTYQPLTMPVLGIGSDVSYNYMKMGLPYVAKNCEVVGLLDSGHYMNEEKPEKIIEIVSSFLIV
ncbi:alpha/beta fold hydrolase [Mucilaginibacter glaciei]|uniref:Alpha/beta hydrolase n=1 Tax=Mucilaginibacter glaciei TaxID=2772109 RepID=A0A926NKK5_9SPHI|nr:alpha/beta hydrolase [Mucilaginibacter glaciei]MBD1392946.1 alpha/beta hydrolase [Mucilaginibacter glaciei]